MDGGSFALYLGIACTIQFSILFFFMWQIGNLAAAARAIEQHTTRAAVLLAVIATKQGATQEDVQAAMAK